MELGEFNVRSGQILKALREKHPLVHNITNYVVMNFSANALLAAGAAPVMAHAVDEVEQMVSLAGALVINIGTLSPAWIEAMLRAGRRANELKVPIILDPVGAGATDLRTGTALRLMEKLEVMVIRGNASEILSLGSGDSTTKGVDSVHGVGEASETAWKLAKNRGTTVVITGVQDFVTDGSRSIKVANGHPLMGTVTGTGCTATAIMGAFLAMEKDPLAAAAAALAYWGLAGERAAESADAPGSYQIALLDWLYKISPGDLEKGSRFV